MIDCHSCHVAGPGCDDCVVNLLLGPAEAPAPIELTVEEQRAMQVFAAAGMLPPLRMSTG